MHEVFKIKSSKLTQNFNNISSILKNLKFLKKSQNLGFKNMNAWNARE